MKDENVGKGMMLMLIVFGIPCLAIAIGAFVSTQTYQCTVTGQDPNRPFGGHFYDVSCVGENKFTSVAGGSRYACTRVGDSVIVTTYGGWFPASITGNSNC